MFHPTVYRLFLVHSLGIMYHHASAALGFILDRSLRTPLRVGMRAPQIGCTAFAPTAEITKEESAAEVQEYTQGLGVAWRVLTHAIARR